MAITLTGAKYAVATLASAGTTTVTVTGTPFTIADFTSPRRVDLYDNALTTFKGTAFARACTSTSVIQLETEFFDPKTGATVTQVAGGSPDKIYVSKNFADIATAGISVSGNVVTISDTITFGTSGDPDSLCFHDEDVIVTNTITTTESKLYDVAGGFLTFGHLQSWDNRSWYGGCHFNFASITKGNAFVATSTSARLCMFGGTVKAFGSGAHYFFSGYTTAAYGTDWAFLWVLETAFNSSDILSKGAGGDWTTGSNHVLENCSFVGAGNAQILVRWGNGTILGGTFKLLRNSSLPHSAFGSDAAGTYALGAAADDRSVILDIGPNLMWRSGTAVTQTLNCTNLISTDYRAGYGATPESTANSSATVNVYFSDSYTNLQDATALAIIKDSDWSVSDSDTASGAASSVSLDILRSTAAGHGTHTGVGPWTYRIRKYGYDELEGAIAESDYSLGTAGTAKDVSFGGIVNQISRASLTGTAATALAYAGITVTDHGASPVTYNSKAFSITIEVDLTTYPSRTIEEVFKHIKAGIAQTATFNGKAGLLWHVLLEEDGASYVTQRGKSGGAGAALKGVRIIDDLDNPFPGVTAMIADDGTTYTPPTTDTRGLAFTGLVAGSQVKVFETGTQTELFSDASSATEETWSESASGSRTVDYTVMKAGYLPIRVTGVIVTGAVSGGILATPIQQVIDRAYVASSGLTFTTNCTITPGTKIVTWSVATTGQNLYSFAIEAWIAEASLKNVEFPFKANGPESFTLDNGWETRGFTTAGTGIANTSLNLLSRDGLRYLDTSHVQTAAWVALLSVGVPAGAQVRYQQTDGGTTVDAANTGNIDQLIQVYGDASHGNFDYTGYLVCKVQEAGYDQVEVDVVTQYGTLEDQLYVIALAPTANGVATGDPALTITVTDHGASPVTWNGKDFSITIVDNATPSSGTDIMRELRHNFEAGGTYQGKDAFNWHDLVQTNGSDFKTVRGIIYGDTGATQKGVRVVKNDGTTAHPDFTIFTADDGTTYVPPVTADISITGLVNAVGASNRLQIINSTALSASAWQAATVYADGDIVKRTTGIGTENTAGLYMRCTTAGTSGGVEPTWDTTPGNTTADNTVVWTTYKVLYYDADPASTSYSSSYTDGNEFLAGETFEVRFAEMDAGTTFKTYHTTGIVSSTGFTLAATMTSDDVYATNALDGSTYDTTFSPDYTNDYVVMDTNTDYPGKGVYAYYCYLLTTSSGMYEFWDGITALDTGNYRIETDTLNLYLDESAGFVKQTDDVRIFRSDGARPALDPTTGGNGIEVNWRVPVSVVETGVSGLTGAESAQLMGLPSASTTATAVISAGALTEDNFLALK